MNVINKYLLGWNIRQTIELPMLADILSVIPQNDGIAMYAICDPKITKMSKRHIVVLGTETEYENDRVMLYIGTVQEPRTPFVRHIFEDLGKR
ncbi:MAG: hypothetical protein U9Q37_03080 [Euryarchaeota archaeon]|nr:hypothetical protein [Euryarchaeota archaeon]